MKRGCLKNLQASVENCGKKLMRSGSSPHSVILVVHAVQLENNLKKTF